MTRDRLDQMVRVVAFLWLLALLVSVVEPQSWSPHTKLTILGASFEVAGIGLLASDLLSNPLGRAWARALSGANRAALAIRARVLGPRTIVVQLSDAATAFADAGTVTVKLTPGSQEDPVDELRRSVLELTNRLAEVEGKQARDLRHVREEIGRTRDELAASIRAAIEQGKGEFLVWRFAGFAIALVGSVLLAVANLV